MKKICVICGSEFTPYHGAKNQLTCCRDCRQIYSAERAKRKYHENREQILAVQKRQNRIKNNGHVICKICGRPIFRDWSIAANHGHMHDECIFDDVITTLRSGFKVSRVQKSRLYSRGYTLGEFISEYEDELNEAETDG